MKSNATFEGVRLFGVKPLGNGCRFGIKVNSKKQDYSLANVVIDRFEEFNFDLI